MGLGGGMHAQLPDLAGEGDGVPRRPGGGRGAGGGARDLSLPTLGDGESWRDIRGFTPDVAALAEAGCAFERLDQLALEHLYGVR
jgi:hypothetical protein